MKSDPSSAKCLFCDNDAVGPSRDLEARPHSCVLTKRCADWLMIPILQLHFLMHVAKTPCSTLKMNNLRHIHVFLTDRKDFCQI